MLSMLRKTAASMAKSGRSSSAEQYGVVFVDDDLSAWELVDASPSDDEDLCSFDGDADVTSGGDDRDDDVLGDETEAKKAVEEVVVEEDERESRDLGSPDDVIFMESVSVPVQLTLRDACDDMYDYDDVVDNDGHGYESYDDDEGVVYDDEVVAWKLEERLGKARTKKTAAKRGGGSRSEKSKRRLPYYYNRPGCVYGKHGLGVQNSYI